MTEMTVDKPERGGMSISMQGIILIVVAASMMSIGSLGLRGAIDSIGGFGGSLSTIHKDIFTLATSPIFIGAALIYAGGTLTWMRVIASEPLSIAFPILMSVAFISITLGAAFFFKEAISSLKLVGMVIIVIGVVVASQG